MAARKKYPNSKGSVLLPSLSDALDLERGLTVAEAAKFNCMHEDTFRKHHGDKIKRVSARLEIVSVKDALAIRQAKV
jgi:hypothetical protein